MAAFKVCTKSNEKDGSWQAIRIEKDEDLQGSLIHTDPLNGQKSPKSHHGFSRQKNAALQPSN